MDDIKSNLVESVEFRVTAPKGQTPGLDDALKKLERLDAGLHRLMLNTDGVGYLLAEAE